jgi:hypothetical protein
MSDTWYNNGGDLDNPQGDEGLLADLAGSLIKVNTEALKDALKPLMKLRTGTAEDPLLRAVLMVPNDNKIIFKMTDMVTYTQTEVSVLEGSRMPNKSIALDVASLNAVMRIQSDVTEIALYDNCQDVQILFAGGNIYIPSYTLDNTRFDSEGILGDVISSRQSSVLVLLDTIQALKRLAAAANRTEMRMLFGYDDHVFACDGTTVMRSECYFIPTAVRLVDADVMEALLQTVESTDSAELIETETYVSVRVSKGTLSFPKRTAVLVQAYRDAIIDVEDPFVVDPAKLLQVILVLKAIYGTEGYATFVEEQSDEGPVFTLYSKAGNGKVSRVVVSRDTVLTETGEDEIRMQLDAIIRMLRGFSGPDLVHMALENGRLYLHDVSVKAAVIMGTVGTDRE